MNNSYQEGTTCVSCSITQVADYNCFDETWKAFGELELSRHRVEGRSRASVIVRHLRSCKQFRERGIDLLRLRILRFGRADQRLGFLSWRFGALQRGGGVRASRLAVYVHIELRDFSETEDAQVAFVKAIGDGEVALSGVELDLRNVAREIYAEVYRPLFFVAAERRTTDCRSSSPCSFMNHAGTV